MSRDRQERLVLLTGATGYIGGHLLGALKARGARVRCFARRPDRVPAESGPLIEVARGDVLDRRSLRAAMQGVSIAYFLVHSMGAKRGFEEQERLGAANFAEAAREARVERIIYLGGLGDSRESLSPHLRTRHEVGDILRLSEVQVIEFRASIVIGAGSLSFEMIRSLVERLPVMVTPRWVRNLAQPIDIEDLVDYLVAAMDLRIEGNRIIELGGADRVSYRDLMLEYARQRGLHRVMIPVPLLSPRLSSLWLGLVTPHYARVGRRLIEGIRHPTVVQDHSARDLFDVRPRGFREAIARAIAQQEGRAPDDVKRIAVPSASSATRPDKREPLRQR